MVACRRNPDTCKWEYIGDQMIPADERNKTKNSSLLNMFENYEIYYDLYLVNGNPEGKNKDVFRFQYSCDNQVSSHC